MPGGGLLRRAAARLTARLRRRPDTEHVMYANRFAFCLAQGTYFVLAVPGMAAEGGAIMTAGLAVTALLFAHLVRGPARSVPRQTAAMVADMAYLGTLMHLGGARMGFWFPCMLWMVLGNGFRLGRANLLRAMAVASLAFWAVVLTTPFWQDHLALAAGVLLGNCVLSLYAWALLTRLHAARRAAQEADKAKSLFLASVSHELRTPLHAIIGMGSLLEKEPLPPGPADMVRTIMGAGRSLLDLIDDVLKLSRMEVDQPPARSVEFELATLLAEVRGLVQAQAHEKGLRVAVHVGAGCPSRVRGDERHVREVLVNLAGNAVKFTERGGILLAVCSPGSDAAAGPTDGVRLRFEVVDTGIGIAPEAHARIFEKFTQADHSVAERFGGTGLGLAICKQLVGMFGGAIGVESSPGAGSTFWFEAPCEAVLRAAPGAAPGAAGLPVAPGTLAVLSIDAGVRATLRAAVRALDPDAIITECSGAAVVGAQLAAAFHAGRTVLADASASRTAAEALQAAVRASEPSELPSLLLVGDPAGAPGPDLRWVAPAWAPPTATTAGLADAIALCGALRPAGVPGTPAHGPAPVSATRQDSGAKADSSRSLTVLVVDDNATNRKVVAKTLESGGHLCRLASDGSAALDALEEADRDGIDLVLMDVNMPGMDGLETTKLHRAASLGLRRVPVLGLTADASPDVARRCKEAGMDGCLTKPVRAAELLAAVEAAVPVAAPPPRAAPPALRVVQAPACDTRILDELRGIGGEGLVQELLVEFLADVGRLESAAGRALEDGDAEAFRAAAHALGSAAANMGAPRVSQLALSMERMRAGEVAAQGRARLRDLARELDAYAAACSVGKLRSRA